MASRYLESTISDNESLDSQSEISQKMVNIVNPLHK